MHIREITAADHETLLAMNSAAAPAVNALDRDALAALLADCGLAAVAVEDGEPVGMVLVLPPGTGYASENYRWFCARYTDFCYLDRVVVDPVRRGAGIGARLHEAAQEYAAGARFGAIALEVNLDPPNPGSLRFHSRLGFTEVGQHRGSGGKLTCMMLRASPTS